MAAVSRRQIEETLEVVGSRLYLRGLDLRGLDLSALDLEGSDLENADLEGADLTGTDLDGANLTGASLKGVSTARASFRAATFDGADLTGVDLTELRSGGLTGVSLRETNLSSANLDGADLEHNTFDRASLRGASLVGADLTSVTFNQADLRGTVLVDAKLGGASFYATVYDESTKWPGGFDIALANVPSVPRFDGHEDEMATDADARRTWSYLDVFVGQSGWYDSRGRRGQHITRRDRSNAIPLAEICTLYDSEGWELLNLLTWSLDGPSEYRTWQHVDGLTLLFRRPFAREQRGSQRES